MQCKLARELKYPKQLSNTLTLSTFHGCPADEIERICEFLITERDLDVIVKMNPPMLGKERLEHLLHDELGYTELTVNPSAYTSGLQFDEAVQLVDRLMRLAHSRRPQVRVQIQQHAGSTQPQDVFYSRQQSSISVGAAVVRDHDDADRRFFVRRLVPRVPISFSAGIDQHNFAHAVACGFVPVTVSSDLLRIGGYGRIGTYLQALEKAMTAVGATNVNDYVLAAFGQANAAKQKTAADDQNPLPLGEGRVSVQGASDYSSVVQWASALNTTIAAEKARGDVRYRADKNRKVPPRIDSHLETFDCITCDKCPAGLPERGQLHVSHAVGRFRVSRFNHRSSRIGRG